jgi:uncharacterized LabA/DUF88 family protein
MGLNSAMPRRTFVYVDGFNFYYGCAVRIGIKWIDILRLCQLSLPSNYEIAHIRYFTAIVKDPNAAARQHLYLRALRTLPNLTIHRGKFLVQPKRMPLKVPFPAVTAAEVQTPIGVQTFPLVNPVPEIRNVMVIKSEEKGSDVNLASYLLLDAFRDRYDVAVIISDDSDLVEPIRIVRREFSKNVTVLSPRCQFGLQKIATRFLCVNDANVAASQFPVDLVDSKGVFSKPSTW